MKIHPYINFNGSCEEAFRHYAKVFSLEEPIFKRFGEMPENPKYPISDEHKDKIMHVSIEISSGYTIMGSDVIEGFGAPFLKGNDISLSINTDSIEQTKLIFNHLSNKGHIIMPLNKTFWNAYFGMTIDQFGVNWMVNHDLTQYN